MNLNTLAPYLDGFVSYEEIYLTFFAILNLFITLEKNIRP